MPNLTPEGCRAARALLQQSVREFGAAVGISGESISAYENGRPMRDSNRARVLTYLEERGVEVLNGNSPGARLRPKAGGVDGSAA